jgi:hypothetical protein
MSSEKYSNGFTQKELNIMVLEKLDKLEEKLDSKLDKSEFYKVLGLIATIVIIAGTFTMGG